MSVCFMSISLTNLRIVVEDINLGVCQFFLTCMAVSFPVISFKLITCFDFIIHF